MKTWQPFSPEIKEPTEALQEEEEEVEEEEAIEEGAIQAQMQEGLVTTRLLRRSLCLRLSVTAARAMAIMPETVQKNK